MKGKKNFITEFKEFISRGNVVDMAVGIIVGSAFTAIVTSLNQDIITPVLGIFGGIDFSAMEFTLGSGANAPVLHYGKFITAVINFLIIALVVFCMIKAISKMRELGIRESEETEEPATKECPFCKSMIPVAATRCPHCTSLLSEPELPVPGQQDGKN